MATTSDWNPFGVSLDVTANPGTVTRISATQFRVAISASWKVHWNGASTNYGMTASSGGGSANLNSFGNYASSGSGSFTGTYSISENGASTKYVAVTFTNAGPSSSKSTSVGFYVNVPASQSYTVSYNANGGTNAPGSQIKWAGETLTLSKSVPTRNGYTFLGWATSSSSSSVSYLPGAPYGSNASITLYAVWKGDTYTVSYNANGGTNTPSNQTKHHGQPLTITSSTPYRDNYSFLGWSTNQYASTPDYRSGDQFYYDGNITLYAVWSLAYTPPRIVGDLNVSRCDYNGNITDEGTYIKIYFRWQTDRPAQRISVNITPVKGTGNSNTIYISGNSGTYDKTIAISSNSSVSADVDVDVHIWIYDNYDSSNYRSFIPGTGYIIDVLAGGKGIAFGRPATKENTMDIGYDVEVHKQISKQTRGGDKVIDARKNAVISCPTESEFGFNAFANSKVDRGSISIGTLGKKFVVTFDDDESYSQGLDNYASYSFDPWGRITTPQHKEVLTDGNVVDYVVEVGSNNNGHYRKWSSGRLEMWGSIDTTPGDSSKPNYGYIGTWDTWHAYNKSLQFPINSTSSPTYNIQVRSNAYSVVSPKSSSLSGMDFWSLFSSKPPANVIYMYKAEGTWK